MAFQASQVEVKDGIARITLSGDLDAAAAPVLRARVEDAAVRGIRRLVLLMHEVRFMASAGLRVLAFAKQKMGPSVELWVVGAREPVRESLTLTGLHRGVVLREHLDHA